MKKYSVEVVKSYIHHVEVEAPDMDTAEMMAFEQFDLSKAYEGEGEIRWTTCLDEPSWLDMPVPLGNDKGETK